MIPTTATTTATSNTPDSTISARRARLVAGFGAVLVAGVALGACGLPNNGVPVIMQRSDRADHGTETTGTTETTDTTEVAETTTTIPADPDVPPLTLPIPVTTVPTTEATVPNTVPATVPVTVPAGAVEIDNGTFVVPAPGWTVTAENGVVSITDGTTSAQVRVLRRTAGEDPSLLMQEYVDTFDAASGTVSYQPVRFTWSSTEPVAVDRHSLWYTTFDSTADTGRGVDGGVHLYRRDDGLSLVYDVWAAAGVSTDLPADMWNSIWDSFVAAPSIGTPVALTAAPTFRVDTVSTPVLVDGLVGLTPAPGFGVVSNEGGSAIVSNGTDIDVEIHTFTAVGDTSDALARAEQIVTDTFGPVTFGDELTYDADGYGVQRRSISWNGSCNGSSCGGSIDVFVDPSTAKSYAVMAEWLWNPADGSAPQQPAWNFMWTSMIDSFDQIL